MILGFSRLDYTVLLAYFLAIFLIGAAFTGGQRDSKDFFLAGRSMRWFPIGMSIMATLLSAISFVAIPGEAYFVGNKQLFQVLLLWLDVPIVLWFVIPLYYNLEIYSIYEYLELRFGRPTRYVASFAFVAWRMLWLGGVIYAPCKVLAVAGDLDVDSRILIVAVGLLTTAYTFLGGMKAVIWTDVIQGLVMILGVAVVIAILWVNVDGGPAGIAATAQRLGRTDWIDPSLDPTHQWSVWAVIPHFFLVRLSFYVADQITAQRFLTGADLGQVKRSFLLGCVAMCLVLPGLVYIGHGLVAFYQQHAATEIPPHWLANNPSLDPVTAHEAARDPATGEIRLAGGRDELLPRFIARHLSWGLAGLLLAALFAASMSSIDSGLNSIATLCIVDFHRGLGIGRGTLARFRRKTLDQLDEHDELWLGRPLVLLTGVVATASALVIAKIDDIFEIMISVINTMGGPLLALFLLGMLTRRATGPAVIIALFLGIAVTIWTQFGYRLGAAYPARFAWLWPWPRLSSFWPLSIGVATTYVLGWLLSFFVGERKPASALAGLVVGLGRPGVVASHRADWPTSGKAPT